MLNKTVHNQRSTRMPIGPGWAAVPLALVALVAATAYSAAQQPITCTGLLSQARVIRLLNEQVAEKRVVLWIGTCGVDFQLTAEREEMLRAVNATDAVLQAIRAAWEKRRAAWEKRRAAETRAGLEGVKPRDRVPVPDEFGLPPLEQGKVVRGRIAVTVQNVPTDAADYLGVGSKRGALVLSVGANGPAERAGVKPGDVIVEFNGQPVTNRDTLVQLVTATKPGTTVPMTVVREQQEKRLSVSVDGLDLEAEPSGDPVTQATEEAGGGLGITLGPLGSDVARRLQVPAGTRGVLVTHVDPTGAGARAGVRSGDVILQVNRRPVESVADASRALQAVRPGGDAVLWVWKRGHETIISITKE